VLVYRPITYSYNRSNADVRVLCSTESTHFSSYLKQKDIVLVYENIYTMDG